jgi:hypothetical protein
LDAGAGAETFTVTSDAGSLAMTPGTGTTLLQNGAAGGDEMKIYMDQLGSYMMLSAEQTTSSAQIVAYAAGNLDLTTSGGDVTITVPGAASGNDLLLVGIDTDPTPTQMLTLTAGNVVQKTTLSGTADQGVIFTSGQYLLGGTSNTEVPFQTNRFINIDGSNLSITSDGGAKTPVAITGGTNTAVALTAYGTGDVTMTSADDVTATATDDITFTATDALGVASATTNVNTASGNVNIGSATGTNTILGTTNINTTGSQSTAIGNSTGTVTVTGATTFNNTTTLANATDLRFSEPTASGSNYTSFVAGTQAADLQYTLPTAAPTSTNRVLTATTYANPMTLAWSNPNAEVVYGVDNTAAWTGAQDNITVPADKAVMRVTATADLNLSGLDATGIANGRIIVLVNVGSNDITIKHNNSSTAANSFKLPGGADITLAPDGSVTVMYDTTSAKWRVLSVN